MDTEASPLIVVARIVAAKGAEEELEQELRGLIAPTRAEAGCLGYDLHRSMDDSRTFVFHESWESPEHLERHLASEHVTGYRARVGDRIESIEVLRLEKVD